MYLHAGKVDIEIEGQGRSPRKLTLWPGDSIRIVPLTKHRVTALMDSEVSTPEVDDRVRLEDRYGRV